MKLRIICILLGVLSGSSAFAEADPTFNGMAKLLHCSIAHRAICAGDYCSDVSMTLGWNNIWIDFENRTIGSTKGTGIGVRVVEVSEAAFNKILFVKLEFEDQKTKEMLITFFPNTGQRMDLRFGIVYPATGKPFVEGFTPNRIIDTGQCEIQQ
jgi:hypothetical protein